MKLLFKNIFWVTILTMFFASCKKEILDINTDPNNPTTASATPDLVLSNALNVSAAIYSNPTSDNRFAFAALWLGHISYSGNYAISTENISYKITTNFGAGTWASVYDNQTDYDFVEQKGREIGNVFYEAIGKLMKAYNFQTLVDLYNNVPYSQALKGTGASKPSYDDGKAIYDDIAKKMDTAISLFKVAIAGSIGGDIMFKADPVKWLKFANTVKLRLLLRQSERADRAAYITAEVAKFTISTAFLTTDATVNPGYLNSAGKTNPFWGANINTAGTYTNDFYRAGQFVIDFLKAHNDTLRIGRLFARAVSTNAYAGNYFGDQLPLVNSKTSTFGSVQDYKLVSSSSPALGILKSPGQDAVIMLAAESYFIQAEAALRGWISGNPQTLYQNGVTESFRFLGLSAAQATAYYSQAGDKQVNWAATTSFQEKLALIIRQKWVALTLVNELEPYNDYRRLKLPADIPLSQSPLSSGAIPNRLLYPQREYEVNGDVAVAQGTITPTSKVWWMP